MNLTENLAHFFGFLLDNKKHTLVQEIPNQ